MLDNTGRQKCSIATDIGETLGVHPIYIYFSEQPKPKSDRTFRKSVEDELRTNHHGDLAVSADKIDSVTDSFAKEHKTALDRLIIEKS